jgi:hypothetical protein
MNTPPTRFSISGRRYRPTWIADLFERAGHLDELSSVFGFLIESPLNGGRTRAGSLHYPPAEIEALNARGVGYSFTLTNTAASREHLEDEHTRAMLARFESPLNSVIVATPLVENFIRDQYPNYKLKASCIYDFRTADAINEATERFDMVALWPELNDDDTLLANLERKDRIMLFGTQLCLKVCNPLRRPYHYYFNSLDHIAYYNHRKYGVRYDPRSFVWPYLAPCCGKQFGVETEDFNRFRELGFHNIKITMVQRFAEEYLGIPWSPAQKVREALVRRLELIGRGCHPVVQKWFMR